MKRKIIKLAAVTMFSGAFLLLLGSMPIDKKISANEESCELNNINNSLNSAVNIDFSMVKQKKYLDEILFNIDKNIVLDEDQRKVVLTDEDYCLVIAGAGAGKTTTVAAKVKYLVDKQNIKPEEILIIALP